MCVLENACFKAKAPRDEDMYIAAAFDSTLRKLRWHYWFWGYYGDSGNEPEQLGEFLLDLIDRNILDAIINNMAETNAKTATVEYIRKTVSDSVKEACANAWISSSSAVRSLSENIQASVKELIDPLLEQRQVMKKKIWQTISFKIDSFLAKKSTTVLKPILHVITRPVLEAFVYCIHGFHTHISNKIASHEFNNPTRLQAAIDQSDVHVDWWSGPLYKSYEIAYRMYSSDMATVAGKYIYTYPCIYI